MTKIFGVEERGYRYKTDASQQKKTVVLGLKSSVWTHLLSFKYIYMIPSSVHWGAYKQ